MYFDKAAGDSLQVNSTEEALLSVKTLSDYQDTGVPKARVTNPDIALHNVCVILILSSAFEWYNAHNDQQNLEL